MEHNIHRLIDKNRSVTVKDYNDTNFHYLGCAVPTSHGIIKLSIKEELWDNSCARTTERVRKAIQNSIAFLITVEIIQNIAFLIIIETIQGKQDQQLLNLFATPSLSSKACIAFFIKS